MRYFIYIITFFVLNATKSNAQTSDNLVSRFQNENFLISYDIKKIPKGFLDYYKSKQKKYGRKKNVNFDIVNPGADFNQTDNLGGLPNRRLIFTSNILSNVCFIYFEKGGVIKGQYLYILEFENRKMKNFLALSMNDQVSNLSDLKKKVFEKKYRVIN